MEVPRPARASLETAQTGPRLLLFLQRRFSTVCYAVADRSMADLNHVIMIFDVFLATYDLAVTRHARWQESRGFRDRTKPSCF